MPENRKNDKPRFQRKTILIKKGLQYKYMLLIIISVLVAFMIVSLDLIWTLSKFVNEHPMLQPLLSNMNNVLPLFAIKIAMYLVIVLIVSAVISHRLAGPIFKFEKSARTVGGGDLTHRVILRKGDHLGDLQESFNFMVESVQNRIKGDRAVVRGSAERLKELAEKIRDDEVKKEMLRLAGNLERVFSEFKLEK